MPIASDLDERLADGACPVPVSLSSGDIALSRRSFFAGGLVPSPDAPIAPSSATPSSTADAATIIYNSAIIFITL